MQQWRKIYTSFFDNDEIGIMPLQIRLFYIGLIVFADDYGRFKATTKWLRAKIFPYDDIASTQVAGWLASLQQKNKIKLYEYNGETFGYHRHWSKFNKPRKDRKEALFPFPKGLTNLQPDDNQATTNGQPDVTLEERRGEEKRGEETASPKFLISLPEELIKDLSAKYEATEKQIRDKAETLYNYCEAKGRKYKNYKAFLLNAVRKDFPERSGEKKSGSYIITGGKEVPLN